MINIGIIGGGLISERHCKVISDNSDCDIVSMLSLGSAKSKALADAFNCTFFIDSDAFFNRELDGVIIASPNHTHVEYLKKCVDLKLPVLVEKPVFNKSDDDISLKYNLNDNDNDFIKTKILIGHHRHHFKKFELLKEILNNGQLGEITSFQGSAIFYKPEHYVATSPWRTTVGVGGPILINFIHEIGLLRELFGEVHSIKCIRKNSTRQNEVEDTIAMILDFEQGVLGTFMVSDCGASPWSWELTSGENSFYPNHSEDCYRITGTKGSIAYPSMKTYIYEGAQDWWQPMKVGEIYCENNDPFAAQLINFINVINGDALPLVSYQDGLKNLQLVEEIINEKLLTN